MMRPVALVGGAGMLAMPFALAGAWIAAWTALVAVSTLALFLVDRHRAYREPVSRWLGLPPSLACASAAALLEPMLGYHAHYDPPAAVTLPGLAALAALACAVLRPLSDRRAARVLAMALALVALVVAAAPRGGREPWAAVGAMPVVAEFVPADVLLVQLPDGLAFAGARLTKSHRPPADLPGVVLDSRLIGLTLCRPEAGRADTLHCSQQSSPEADMMTRTKVSVRELPRLWLVTDELGSDLRRHPKYTSSVAFSKATLDPAPLHPWDLGVRLAAPARWSHVAAGGLVLSLLAAVYCLLRAARHRWMLRASAGTHLGEGVIALGDATAHVDATAPLGDVAVVVTGEPPAAYRENATLARLLPGTPAQVRGRWLDGLAGDLAVCGLVALVAAAPVLVAVLLGHSLLW